MNLKPGHLKRILLISIDAPGHYSLALPLLKGYAECDDTIRKTIKIKILRVNNKSKASIVFRKILKTIITFRPQVIGFSCYIWNAITVRKCCSWIHFYMPHKILFLGGQEITPPIEEVENAYPYVQILIPGAGEVPFRSLINSLLEYGTEGLSRTQGIYFKSPDKKWHFTETPCKILNLDEIPSAYLTGNICMPEDPLMGVMIEMTRGCPFKCNFCFEANRLTRPLTFSFERVEEEIRWLRRKGYRRFHILDPILCFGRRIQEFHEVLSKIDMQNTHISAEIYAEHIKPDDRDSLKFITDCDIGLQSTNPDAIKIMQRLWQKEAFERGVSILKEAGKIVSCYLLIGLPGDNLESFQTSLDYITRLRPTKLFCNPLLALRGTTLRDKASEYALKYNPNPPYEVYECNTFSKIELDRAKAFGALSMNTYNINGERSITGPVTNLVYRCNTKS